MSNGMAWAGPSHRNLSREGTMGSGPGRRWFRLGREALESRLVSTAVTLVCVGLSRGLP